MIYNQKKNKNIISVDLVENGIIYKIKDESMNRTENIPYENILNEQYEIYESNKTFKNNAIYGGIVGVLFLAINIFYGTRLWAWLFLLSSPTFYYLYHRSKTAFTVIKTTGEINIFILQDNHHDEILDRIYKTRNSYLQGKYLSINYENDPQSEINKFNWLKELGVITKREYQVIHEEILNSKA